MPTHGEYRSMPVAWIWTASCIVISVAIIVRMLVYDTVTSDYTYFISQWFEMLRTHPGLTAFQWPFSDYSPGYLYLLKLVTYIPVSSLYSSKAISVICDVIIAVYVARIWQVWRPMTSLAHQVLVGAIVFAIPTMIINGALWGQSDSVYAAGVIAALYYMLVDRPRASAIAFGLALSIKLQAIFFAPIMLGFFAYKRAYYAYAFLVPLVYVLSVIPVWFGGGSVTYWIATYLRQPGTYTDLSVSAPSLFAFIMPYALSPGMREGLMYAGIAVAGIIALAIAWYVWRMYVFNASRVQFIRVVTVCVLILPFVLPRMHERYFYLFDIVAVIYALAIPRRWFIPVAGISASVLSYTPFLSPQIPHFGGIVIDLRVPALIFGAILVVLMFDIVRWERRRARKTPANLVSTGAPASWFSIRDLLVSDEQLETR